MTCTDKDKFLVLYSVLRLQHLSGKVLIFVNSVERCYKVRLFLEQFSIKAAVLNAELPQNSRLHILDQFNRGVCDVVVATDDAMEALDDEEDDEEGGDMDEDISGDEKDDDQDAGSQQEEEELSEEEEEEEMEDEDRANEKADGKRKRKGEHGAGKRQRTDAEYGVSRGIDFKDVAAVVNMDFPARYANYVHRVGRTARGTNSGVAFSLVDSMDEEEETALENVIKRQADAGRQVAEYHVRSEEFTAFRYRVEDVLSNCTRLAVNEARQSELRREILNSEKLKAHFEDNPKDKDALRHDKPADARKIQPHLAIVPRYLLPKDANHDLRLKRMRQRARGKGKGQKGLKGGKGKGGKGTGRGSKVNPLKSFKAK